MTFTLKTDGLTMIQNGINKLRILITVTLLGSLFFSFTASANEHVKGLENLPKLANMQQAGVLVLDRYNQPMVIKNASQGFVPASTAKVLTAYLALQHWGEQHQFKTDFFIKTEQDRTVLWVKGYGDPFLVSEELMVIAKNLSGLLRAGGIKQVDEIRLDTTFFVKDLMLPGISETDNPYDAVPSPLAANFNTLFLFKRLGKVYSAEPQTPLTPLAIELGQNLTSQRTRVNTGQDARVSQRYFAELLAAFVRQQGVIVGDKVSWQTVDAGWAVDYQHLNSMSLAAMIRPMLKYSTNFVASQLALMMAGEVYGAPVDSNKVGRLFQDQLNKYFNWSGAVIEEGAGLSRANRLNPQQLVELLQAFKPWQALLPEVEPGVVAKSGTLLGVSTLAGYLQQGDSWLPFALMINQPVPYGYRNEVAKQLQIELSRVVAD